jgi:hypothetical protein
MLMEDSSRETQGRRRQRLDLREGRYTGVAPQAHLALQVEAGPHAPGSQSKACIERLWRLMSAATWKR